MNTNLYATSRQDKVIRAGVIWVRLQRILDPKGQLGVGVLDPISKFIVGENPQVVLADLINKYVEFRKDNLKMTVGELRDKEKVLHVNAAVIQRYGKDGWKVMTG